MSLFQNVSEMILVSGPDTRFELLLPLALDRNGLSLSRCAVCRQKERKKRPYQSKPARSGTR